MAIIFCVDVSAHLLLLWGAGSRQELDISSVHSHTDLPDCSRGGRQLWHSMSSASAAQRAGKDGGTWRREGAAAAGRAGGGSSPSRAGWDKGKDSAARRRESEGSGAVAQIRCKRLLLQGSPEQQ